jgi:FMN reductase
VELRDLAQDITNNLLTGFPSGDLGRDPHQAARRRRADRLTPVFSASYSGLFKSFFDVLEDGTLEGKPVLVGATAGTGRHSLVLEFAMRPLFAYLRAVVVPTAVFGASEDFGSNASGSLAERVDRAGRELADLVVGRRASGPVDPFDNPTPFEQLLSGG